MVIFEDRLSSVKFGVHSVPDHCVTLPSICFKFQVLLKLTENFWKNRRCGFSSISEPRDVIVRGFSLAERVLRVSSRRCRLKPVERWKPNVEYDDVREDNQTG
jgi:hypothetical protein